MSFAAEPYGVFVDDLVSSLTGGVTRERFTFLDDQKPFTLAYASSAVTTTVRVNGLVAGEYFRFTPGTDFDVTAGTIVWRESAPGVPAARATWPDRGSDFYASYERTPDPGAPPRLTDRNPGSIVRTLAESFAREYAVLSRQLEGVYRAGFLGTAEGRDLDQVVALVGVERRTRTFARGEVVFTRATPAPADIFIPSGTRVSTGEVPASVVETVDPGTLRAGAVSVAVPVQALVAGPDGVEVPIHGGSYGVGVSRLVGAIIEACHDEAGITWPEAVAPFRAIILNLKQGAAETDGACEQIYKALSEKGIEPLYHDLDERPGAKFATADLIGVPWQILVGPRSLAEGKVEVKRRADGTKELMSVAAAIDRVSQ
jgi:hypothetical protein